MIGFGHSSPQRAAALLAALVLTACPSDDSAPIDTDNAGSTNADDTATDDTGNTSVVDSSSGGEDLCGNGEIDPGETCDDANTEDGDECPADCRMPSCSSTWTWREPIEMGNPGANAAAVDGEANVYVAGAMEGTDNDIWVSKWASDGSQAWAQTYDSGNGIDVGRGITIDDAGDLYIAGRVTGDGDAMYFARLSGADGSVMWEQTIDSMFADEDDIGIDAALTPDGDVVVAGRMRVGDGDDDVWVSRRSGADGSEVWATTWSGAGDGMFSTERVGALDVGPDGTIWVAAREFVDFETQEAIILRFDADGNLSGSDTPLADGMPHEHNALDVAAHEGGAYVAFSHGSAPYRAWIYSYDNDNNEQWVINQDDWLDKSGEEYRLRFVDVSDAGTVQIGGNFSVEGGPGDHEWTEAWVAQLDADSNFVCRGAYMEDDGTPFAPSLTIFAGAGGPDGGIAMSGRIDEGGGTDSLLWTGYFAP